MKIVRILQVGDKVKLCGCPFDEQVVESMREYRELKDQVMTVLKVKKVPFEGTSGQWIQTDKMSGWVDRAWFEKVKSNENTKKS